MGEVTASDRARRIAGWGLTAFSVLLLATMPISTSGDVYSRPGIFGDPGQDAAFVVVVVLAFVLSGAVLVHLRPRNLIGWLLLACGGLQSMQLSSNAYGARALTDPDGSLPLGLTTMWLASWTWLPALLLPVLVLPAIYPTGRPPSRFWAWHVRVSLSGIAAVVLLAATVQGVVDDTVEFARLPWDLPRWSAILLGVIALVLIVPATATSLVGTTVRAARARAPERQQLVWLISVIGAVLVTTFLPVDFLPLEFLFVLSYAFVPVAVVIGVLRYRLLGIEVVLRRGLLYLPLTLLVALTVGGLTTVLARVVPDGPLPLVLSSAVVAVMVFPVAGGLRRLVDRFVLGQRADPLTVVDRVSAGLEVATDDPVTSMVEAVATAAGASYASVTDEAGAELARLGEPVSGSLRLPLRHRGEVLGGLAIGPRRGEPRVTDRDARLIGSLVPHVAAVVRASSLARDLARQRERVVSATLAERDRLRRDLHDSLGPSLSGIALGLEAAEHALDRDPRSAHHILARTREEADAAVREVRRVLDGLRPSSLDRHGLLGAVRETATGLGLGRPGGARFYLEADEMPALTSRVEEAAYRIVAESLTNVVRHSGAGHCEVRLAVSDGGLEVGIDDDGSGPFGAGPPGVGLDSMRRRAVDLGGRLDVRALQPHGTGIIAVLPLADP